eukprot:evm.model.scf_1202EXC.1 EVM.evm.TU.scf_1202EXC.1   scf_1202EXC:19101-21709(-)
MWVRASPLLNRLSGTNMFELRVVRSSSLRHIHTVFRSIDKDGTGRICLRELKQYMQRSSAHMPPFASSIFNTLDRRKTGRVTFRRFMRAMFPTASRRELDDLIHMARPDEAPPRSTVDEETIEEVEEIFRIYDDSGDGNLDQEEFYSAMQICGYTDEEVEAMFKEIDADGSGAISLEEFVEWYTKAGTPAGEVPPEDASSDEEAADRAL